MKRTSCNGRMVLVKMALASTSALAISPSLAQPISGPQSTADGSAQPSAVEDQGASGGVEDIVVTAQRRDENLQKVPISVQSFSGDQLAAKGITSTLDLPRVVPGLVFGRGVGIGSTFLRGVGTGSSGAGVENSVALYVDGVYYATKSAAISDLANISRIEVLKGPQGTLFGRNASGGLIHIITGDPADTPKLTLKAGYGNFDTLTASGHGSLPLAEGLAVNLAASYTNQGDGWGKNLATGKDVSLTDQFNTRSKIKWEPSDSTKVILAGDYAYARTSVGLAIRPIYGLKPARGPLYTGGQYDIFADQESKLVSRGGGASLKVEQDLSFGRFLSISAWRKSTYDALFDNDYTTDPWIKTNIVVDEKQYTQEFQLSGGTTSTVQWTTGLYFFAYKGTQDFYTYGNATPTLQFSRRYGRQWSKSQAIYAQATKELLPNTRLTLGGRYTWEQREVNGFVEQTSITGVLTSTLQPKKKKSFSDPTWRIAVEHDFAPDVLGYASYNRGFKSGIFNVGNPLAPAVNPEVIDAYEVGFKSTFLDRKVRLNAAAFYNDFSDIQLSAFVSGQPQSLRNAARAEIYGLDVDFEIVPTPGLRFSGSAEWLHARYTSFPGAPGTSPLPGGGNSVIAIDASGNHMLRAPDFSASAAIDYSIPVGDGSVDFNVNYTHSSKSYQEISEVLFVSPIDLINARVAWNINPQYRVSVWGRNLTNKFYFGQMNALNTASQGSAAEPRAYGIDFQFEF